MISLSTFGLYVLACLAIALTPGPDMLYVLSRSIAQGPLAGLVSVVGFSVGITFHALGAAFGLVGLFAASPRAYALVQYAGAAYLAWMAFTIFRSPDLPFFNNAKTAKAGLWRVFRQALICNLLNPKIILFFIALFPQFLNRDEGSLLAQTLLLILTLNLIGGAVNGLVALLGGRFGVFMSARPGLRRGQKYVLGMVFSGLAIRLALGRSE